MGGLLPLIDGWEARCEWLRRETVCSSCGGARLKAEHLARWGSVDDLVIGFQLTHSGRFCRPHGPQHAIGEAQAQLVGRHLVQLAPPGRLDRSQAPTKPLQRARPAARSLTAT